MGRIYSVDPGRGECPSGIPSIRHRPASEFAGSPYKVHLRGLEGQSTKVDLVNPSARLQSQRGQADCYEKKILRRIVGTATTSAPAPHDHHK
jgi:hypothetical protein